MKSIILFGLLCGMLAGIYAKPELFEGDIIMDNKLRKIINDPTVKSDFGSRVRRSVSIGIPTAHEHRWKHGFIPYVLSVDLGKQARKAIEQAFIQIEKYTCVQFSPKQGEKDYIEFIKDNGCYSNIGRQKGGQVISIGMGCEYMSNVVHEILHALGMFHEQTRIDRDLYVHVLWWNVLLGAERNFDVYHHGVIDSMHFPYDFKSATHYSNKDFSKNGADTIQAIGNPGKALGSHRGMSKIDMKKINIFYKCYQKRRFNKKKAPCRDRFWLCSKYLHYCKASKWFGPTYCQKSCELCFS